jgi:hypothetical protein
MSTMFLIIGIGALITISIQDFIQRLIWWFLFPIAAICFVLYQILNPQIKLDIDVIFLNMEIIVLMIIIAYLLTKHNKYSGRYTFFEGIGIGDILMIIISATLFSSINFLIFLLASFILSLTIGLILSFVKKADHSIPLAGVLSIVLLILILLDKFSQNVNLQTIRLDFAIISIN